VAAPAQMRLGPLWRALRLYGPALAPLLPLLLLVAVLAGIALAQPSQPSAPAAPRRWVVANTDGAGVFLRNSPNLTDRKAVVPEGALVLEVGPSPDPAWRHVSLAPAGPAGWVPAQYVRAAP
jgi:hypothetical protein